MSHMTSPPLNPNAADSASDSAAEPAFQAIDGALPEVLAIVEPLVAWLVRSGVGHARLAAALKPVFLEQARRALERDGARLTDSALSLRSGLHRKDVRSARSAAADTSASLAADRAKWGRPSLASQVLSRWLALPDSPVSLPLTGETPSFESLARSVSSDVRPRVILEELIRLELVRSESDQVHRLSDAFVPDRRRGESRALFAGSAADHLHAGVHNLSGQSGSFLEQSVFANGLSETSIAELNRLANALWSEVRDRVIEAAVPLCERDRDCPDPRRFRLGMYGYHAPDEGGKEQ